MLELPHVLVGAAIATIIPNPVISVPLSLVSHFLGDYVPHWNPSPSRLLKKPLLSTWVILFIDSSLAVVFSLTLVFMNLNTPLIALNFFLCSTASAFPDLVEIPLFLFGKKNTLILKLSNFQKHHQFKAPPIPGLLSQLTVILLCLLIIFH